MPFEVLHKVGTRRHVGYRYFWLAPGRFSLSTTELLGAEDKIEVLSHCTTASSVIVPCKFLEENIPCQLRAHMATPSAGSWKPVT